MCYEKYIGHTRPDIDSETQLLIDHLKQTAQMAQKNASGWGEEFAYACGLIHDIGKYSTKFQSRIRGNSVKVDHATAGGQLLQKLNEGKNFIILAAYCILGHHTGLQNGGSIEQPLSQEKSLYYRLQSKLEDYDAYKKELAAPEITLPTIAKKWECGFDIAFFIRMLFSALVDADWLDTEAFCTNGKLTRGKFSSISELNGVITKKTSEYLQADTSQNDLNARRNSLLSDCLLAANQSPGLFTLTAPTGSGKTISSLAFALKHATASNKRRVIYVAPYNTIIEQNASEYEKYIGIENVLRHNSDAVYDNEDETSLNKRLSTENWDYPVIVTSNVQFFESLFTNKKAKCRKLHNIANSVLIFDEAQMIPVPFLKPCVKAIETLVTQYGCTAVLATATQSSLDKFFTRVKAVEITANPIELYAALRRASIEQIEESLTYHSLAQKIAAQKQALCIVNTRKAAQELFRKICEFKHDGVFHLSTTMYPEHRKQVLAKIRQRLKNIEECFVVSTSLVEAGVDLDFETVFREEAGLDSVVQAAGRCNREGKRDFEKSNVYVFTTEEHNPPRMIEQNINAFNITARKYADLAGLDAIGEYFEHLHYILGDNYLDSKGIIDKLNDGMKSGFSFPFEDIGKEFKLIDDSAGHTIYVLNDAPELDEKLRTSPYRSRELFRELGKYAVSLYDNDFYALKTLGAVEELGIGDERVYILFQKYYKEDVGVDLFPSGGQALTL